MTNASFERLVKQVVAPAALALFTLLAGAVGCGGTSSDVTGTSTSPPSGDGGAIKMLDIGTPVQCQGANQPTTPNPTTSSYDGQLVRSYPSGTKSTEYATTSGGGAVQNPVIELVFWGNMWSEPSTPTVGQVVGAFQTMVDAGYFASLWQYGVESVTLDTAHVNVQVDDPPATYHMSDIEGRLAVMLEPPSDFPSFSSNTIFLFVMPFGYTSGDNPCGAHSYYPGLLGSPPFPVGYVTFNDLDTLTMVGSHEIVETITDPLTVTGWQMQPPIGPNSENEIADACGNIGDYVDGVLVQSYWSNILNECTIGFPTPTITSMTPTYGNQGDGVTFVGTHLDGRTSVSFGGVASPAVSCPTTTACVATVPPGSPVWPGSGSVPVVLESDYQQVAGGTFTYVCASNTTAPACEDYMSVNPVNLTVAQGDGAGPSVNSVSTELTLVGAWVGDVGPTLKYAGLPEGVSCEPPIGTAPAVGPTTITCTTSPKTPVQPDPYPIGITATVSPYPTVPGIFYLMVTSCQPLSCSGFGYACGPLDDGCGDTLECGTCASGETCTAGACYKCAERTCPVKEFFNLATCECEACPCGTIYEDGHYICDVCR